MSASSPRPTPAAAVRAGDSSHPRAEIARLRDMVMRLEAERESRLRRRRRHVLLVGLMLSLAAHIALIIYLSSLYREGPNRSGAQPVAVTFATVQEQELTELDAVELDDLLPDSVSEVDELAAPDALELTADVPAAELEIGALGSQPTLGGAGDGGDAPGLAGGGGGASFFGVSASGTRFAYIVDVSGSMARERKLFTAMQELARSIGALPDFASFYIVLFHSTTQSPPMQDGWLRARESIINRVVRWINAVPAEGGTSPTNAFYEVFDLAVRPDVVFFLTDGRFDDGFTAEHLVQLNSRGKPVVVNTIAFGSEADQEALRAIAEACGGTYRYVPAGVDP